MKRIMLVPLMVLGGVLSLSGQLNSLHNHYREGDVLIKQQVEFVDPGDQGVNKVWDFRGLKTDHREKLWNLMHKYF